METRLSETRKKIRAILDEECKPIVELGRILPGAGDLEVALKAAKVEHREEKDTAKKAVLSNLVARIHLDSGRYAEAEKEALKSVKKRGIPNPVRALAYSIVAVVYLRREEYIRTERYCKKALALTEGRDDDVLVHILNIMGSVCGRQQKPALALEYYQAFRKVSERIGNRYQLISAIHNIAVTLGRLGKEDKALEYVLRARKIALELGDKFRLGFTLNLIGYYYFALGKLEKALAEEEEALRIFQEIGHKPGFADCHIDLARIHLGLGNPDIAAEHAAKALACAEELEQRDFIPTAHEVMALVLVAQNNPLAEMHFAKSIKLYRDFRPDENPEGIEFVMLEYGKYLLASEKRCEAAGVRPEVRNKTLKPQVSSLKPQGASLIREAAEILKKRPATPRVKKAREELKNLLKAIPRDLHPANEGKVEKIERDRDNLRKVLEITKAINSEMEVEGVLGRIIDTAIEATGTERGFIVLVEKDRWKFAVMRNFVSDVHSEPDYQVMREIVTKVIADSSIFTAGNIRHSEVPSSFVSQHPSTLKGVFAFPLTIKDKVIGAVYLDSRYAVVDISQDALGFMNILMEQVALIVEKARLYEKVRILSEKRGEKLRETRLDLEQKQQELELRYGYKNIIGKSPKMQELFQLLDKIIESGLPVYICGKSGTGKELVAKAIHYNGLRKKKHFVALNCAAIPESLLESELFGYEKGAFTGADTTKKGLFEIADGGTFFLDEVGNMSERMQQKLLRALQEKAIRRIGGEKLIDINTRIISASNRNAQELIEAGELREDLFYRLNVLAIDLPPLRERKEDIPLLVEHFWEKATGSPLPSSTAERRNLLNVLLDYDWPGNIRELENEIYRLALIGDGTINPKYLSRQILNIVTTGPVLGVAAKLSYKEMEESLIKAALREAKGNKSLAARIIGIPRGSLRNKIKKYGISYSIEVSL